MSKICVLAEKPSVGRDIARVLGCSQGGSGFFEGEGYIVTWALGHLVTLADPEKYGAEYQEWRMDALPILPEHLELVVIRQTMRQYQCVKKQLHRPDVAKIVIATDAGREGELVARWILEASRVRKPLQRLWISSVTDKAIREGFRQLRSGSDYESLYHAAEARAASDWYVGINATRALTCKFNAQLSCGRVQTPTLAMIAQREKEISRFQPEEYYGVQAICQGLQFSWRQPDKSLRVFQRGKAERICQRLAGKYLEIHDVQRRSRRLPSPQLYDLTTLQSEANQRYGYSAKETLAAMQSLYEVHKILTYPRTDSRYLTEDIVPTLRERLQACGIGEYSRMAFAAGRQLSKLDGHIVDNDKVSDHHAIIPTEQFVNLSALSSREGRIYDLVVRRFLAALYPACEYEEITLEAVDDGEAFAARGRVVKQAGWRQVYETEEDEEELPSQQLPAVQPGSRLAVDEIRLTTGQTKPPAPFTEGTLLRAMENPAASVGASSKELRRKLQEAGGIGTVATRADIIEKLYSSFYVEKKGQALYTTAKGRQLLELVPAELRSPELTARWEQQLSAIAAGKLAAGDFLGKIKQHARQLVSEIKDSAAVFHHDNLTRKKCPDCGKFLLEVNGKHGRMLVCQDRACGYRHTLSRSTNARCPECHKRMELKGEGENKFFACACGYREKLSAFRERREKAGSSRVSKRDVSRYLQSQEQGFANNALAEALAGLQLKD